MRADVWSGSRRLHPDQLGAVRCLLLGSHRAPGKYVAVHGDCPSGLDRFVRDTCEEHGIHHLPMPAPWDALGKPAGQVRNEKMAEVALALAFCGYEIAVRCYPDKDSKGTRGMIAIAKREDLPLSVTEM